MLKNLYTPMSKILHFSSRCLIKFLLVSTFLTSSMVFVLYSISSSSNSCLFLELRNLMSSVASLGLSPNCFFTYSMASLDLSICSCCSNIICIDGQITMISSFICFQKISLTWARVLPMEISFSICCNL